MPVKYAEVTLVDRIGMMVDPRRYVEVLPEIAPQLPSGARRFATEPGHYEFSSPRCVKDLRLESATYTESGLELEVVFLPNPWKHTEGLRVQYRGVERVELTREPKDVCETRPRIYLDELLPTESGCTHEVEMNGAFLKVWCADLTATWEPTDGDV